MDKQINSDDFIVNIQSTETSYLSDPDKSTVVWIGGVIICIILPLSILYFSGVGLTYGFVIAAWSDYDVHTGCPYDNPNCTFIRYKMPCYNQDLGFCFGLGFATMWLIPLICLCAMLVFG